jgi:DNA polymerase-3 subunit delta
MEQQDPFSIFGMVIRQFRLLLLTREILDRNGQRADIIRELKIAPFVADKLMLQARHFSLPVLEQVYHRLLDLDEAMKTGQIGSDLALDTLVTVFAAP